MFRDDLVRSFLDEENSPTSELWINYADRQKKTFHPGDYVIFALVLLISLGIGFFHAFHGDRQNTTSEYLMGKRKLRLIPVATSMFMSYISAVLLLGTSAEMYRHGVQYWWASWGSVLAAVLSAHLFVPTFYQLRLVSSFEYLELRFRRSVKRVGTVLSIISSTFYMGVAMYSPATALEAVTEFPAWLSIIITGIVVTIYTTVGGMKAVVWTDVFQGAIYLLGVILVLALGTAKAGGLGEVFRIAKENGRLNFFTTDSFNPDPTIRLTLWSMIFGRMFSSLYFATGQTTVQRYSALPTQRKAFISVILNIPAYIIMYVFACLIGLVVFAYYTKTGCDPLRSGKIRSSNQILPYFVVDALDSPGVPGLFISVLFCGTLSSVSSSLNSLSAITWTDFLEGRYSHISEFRKAFITKILVSLYGVLGIGIAFIVQNLRGHVLMVTQSFISSIGGPLTAMFLLGIFFPCTNSIGVVTGAIVGVGFGMWMAIGSNLSYYHRTYLPTVVANCTVNTTVIPTNPPNVFPLYKLSFMLYVVFATLAAIVIGVIVSLITGSCKLNSTDRKLLVSVADKFCCCLPRSWRKSCYCGVPYDAQDEERMNTFEKAKQMESTTNLEQSYVASRKPLTTTDIDDGYKEVRNRYSDVSTTVQPDHRDRSHGSRVNKAFESTDL